MPAVSVLGRMSARRQPPLVGFGAIGGLPDLVTAVGRGSCQSRVMTVVGAGFSDRPWAPDVLAVLDRMGTHIRTHRGLPVPESVSDLHAEVTAFRPDVLVAIGGGSVIDAAKAAAALAATGLHGAGLAAHIRASGLVPTVGIPVVAVPTTPGTGAETTPFATVWDTAGGRKLSVSGPAVRPAGAVLDPRLLDGLRRDQLAGCVLDTLAQGIEAAWSVSSTAAATAYGLTAVATVAPVLDAVAGGRHHTTAVRTALMLGGYHSGLAIALAETNACHALSYPLTLRLGLAHGHACGVVLARLLRYNAGVSTRDCADPRGVGHVRSVLADLVEAFDGASTVDQAAGRVDAFLGDCALAPFDDLAVDHAAIAAEAVGYRRCHNNPRVLDAPTLTRLLSARTPSEIGDLP